MLKTTFSDLPSPTRILAIGCHSDDIEIGCGGTILTLIESLPSVEVCWVVLSASGERAGEARRSAEAFLEGAAATEVIVHDYRDGFLPYVGGEVKQVFEDLKGLRAGSRLHPLLERPPPGSPPRRGADLEHLPEPPRPRIRDSEIRRGLRLAERLRRPDGRRRGTEGSAAPRALPDAAGAALVYGGSLPRGATNPRDGIEFAVWARRGLLRPQGGSDARSEGGGSRERRRSDPRRRGAPVQHDPVEKGA